MEEFFTEFMDQFKDPNTEKVARNRLHLIKQKSPARMYGAEFSEILLDIPNLDEGTKIDFFVRVLKNESKMKLVTEKFATLDEAITLAGRIDTAVYSIKTGTNMGKSKNTDFRQNYGQSNNGVASMDYSI